MALRIVFVMKMFWSFGFVLLGIVSNFVLRYSDFSPAKENDYVGPFQRPSSSHWFYRWSLTHTHALTKTFLRIVSYHNLEQQVSGDRDQRRIMDQIRGGLGISYRVGGETTAMDV